MRQHPIFSAAFSPRSNAPNASVMKPWPLHAPFEVISEMRRPRMNASRRIHSWMPETALKRGWCVCPQALDKQPCVHRCSYVHQPNIHAWVCAQSQVYNGMWKEIFSLFLQENTLAGCKNRSCQVSEEIRLNHKSLCSFKKSDAMLINLTWKVPTFLKWQMKELKNLWLNKKSYIDELWLCYKPLERHFQFFLQTITEVKFQFIRALWSIFTFFSLVLLDLHETFLWTLVYICVKSVLEHGCDLLLAGKCKKSSVLEWK